MDKIRFKFSAEKALAAIHWMVSQHSGIDMHALLKACYFADKEHLNRYFRPIFGARYKAMKFGPVPVEIYDMAKGDPYFLAELKRDRLPWVMNGYCLTLRDNNQPDISDLSESDMECLIAGFNKSTSMTFTERTEATHGKDWQKAMLGTMAYEDMLDEGIEDRELIVENLRETAHKMVL